MLGWLVFTHATGPWSAPVIFACLDRGHVHVVQPQYLRTSYSAYDRAQIGERVAGYRFSGLQGSVVDGGVASHALGPSTFRFDELAGLPSEAVPIVWPCA